MLVIQPAVCCSSASRNGSESAWRLAESEVRELDEASASSAEFARGIELI